MQTIEKNGKTYAIVPIDAWQRLITGEVDMPALPEAAPNGDRLALPFMRAIIARGIIRDRVAAGLSQAELARRAGIESATLNRIERAKVTPDEATIRKIDRAIANATRKQNDWAPTTRAHIRKMTSPKQAGVATPRRRKVG